MQNHTKELVLNSALIGFEFEFLIKMDALDAVRSLSKKLDKRIVLPLNVDKLNNPVVKYHTPIEVTDEVFKLEVDFSGGINCHELITGPMEYKEARKILLRVFSWIKENAMTNDRCSLHINISFDETKIKTTTKIENINILKFCLNFNEDYIYKNYPNRKDSIYANSIKKIFINNIFNLTPSTNQLKLPNKKYYGVNFLKSPKGYLEFRYIGEPDYEKKPQKILNYLDYFINFTYTILQFPENTKKEHEKLSKILNDFKPYLDVYKDPLLFKEIFSEINLTIDLAYNEEVLKSLWNHIRNKIMTALISGNFKKGDINYDTNYGIVQIKDAKLTMCELTNYEFINCIGNGFIYKSLLKDCNFSQIVLEDCKIDMNNNITSSKLKDCYLEESNIIKDSYIDNSPKHIINCKVIGGIVRNGVASSDAEISEETSIVSFEVLPKENNKPKVDYGVYHYVDLNQYKEKLPLTITQKKS